MGGFVVQSRRDSNPEPALRVSRATLYRMVKRGDIEVVRLSGRDAATIRIPVRAIERLAGGKDAAVLTLGVGADVERPPVAGEEPDPRRAGRSDSQQPKEAA